MHIGYELKELEKLMPGKDIENFFLEGKQRYKKNKIEVKKTIDSFMLENGQLDGSKMQENWFQQVQADVFICHSHKDEKLAIAFSEWLFNNFNLKTFIDSCVWGYSDNLLKLICDKYCSDQNNYVIRDKIASHVNTMLTDALSMMIDKAECIIFLNTPNSITQDDNTSITESPWIKAEISKTKIIRQRPIEDYRDHEYRKFMHYISVETDEIFTAKYTIDKSHLKLLTVDKLNIWQTEWVKRSIDSKCALDLLYDITKIVSNAKE